MNHIEVLQFSQVVSCWHLLTILLTFFPTCQVRVSRFEQRCSSSASSTVSSSATLPLPSSASPSSLWAPTDPDLTASASSSGAISLQKLVASSTAVWAHAGPNPMDGPGPYRKLQVRVMAASGLLVQSWLTRFYCPLRGSDCRSHSNCFVKVALVRTKCLPAAMWGTLFARRVRLAFGRVVHCSGFIV